MLYREGGTEGGPPHAGNPLRAAQLGVRMEFGRASCGNSNLALFSAFSWPQLIVAGPGKCHTHTFRLTHVQRDCVLCHVPLATCHVGLAAFMFIYMKYLK